MLINVMLSVAFLWTCRRCVTRLKQIAKLRKKIMSSTVHTVAQALQKFASLPKGAKVFMIVRGLIKMKTKIEGEKSIHSIMQNTIIRKGKLSDYLMRKGWDSVAANAHWKQPYKLENTVFNLQDMNGLQLLQIRGAKQGAVSGALNQVFKDIQKYNNQNGFFVNTFKNIYNFFVSRFPFSWILNPSVMGEELTLYSILDGQYSVVVGQFRKDQNGAIFCALPNYITKQMSYVSSRLRKKHNRLCLITALLILLLSITGVKLLRQIYIYFKGMSNRIGQPNNGEENRSQSQGDNCNCTLCYVSVRNIIFKPCRHYAICKSCYQQLPLRASCPFCKIPIQGIIEVVKKK